MNIARNKYKFIVLILALSLAFGLAGCKAKVDPQTAQAIQDAQAALQAEENGGTEETETASADDLYAQAGLTPIAEDDPLWADVEREKPAIAQLLAYKATFADTFDENEPSADDFWTVTGMGVTAVPPEKATDFNKINHVQRAVVLDYAAALLPGYEAGGEAPKLEDVYGVSDNPKSDIIDIDGLSINVTPTVVLLGTDEKSGQTVLRMHIEDKEGLIAQTDWDVLLAPWEDEEEHALPLVVKQFYSVN
ncbi:MAG: hypothetical protein K5772_08525 [Clostridia bacterium]|nr:hypothetical protein [Clostridia bacterium]